VPNLEARLTDIDPAEALRYLGIPANRAPAELTESLERCRKRVLETARPRAVWRLLRRLPSGGLEGTALRLEGEAVRALLDGCSRVVLLAATLGAETEALLRRAQARNMADAVMLDACASAAIENVCDNLCADVEAELAPWFLTERFSPGYGDLPLTEQAALLQVLDAPRRIGVTLTGSGVMLPQKTVTALAGVTDRPRKRSRRSCESCTLAGRCGYRKEGIHCEQD